MAFKISICQCQDTQTPLRSAAVYTKVTISFRSVCCVLKFSWMFILLEESSIPPTCLSQILLRMIGSTVRYFILRCVSLWSAYCVLNSVSELLGETLRKRWLHEEKNMIARTLLIFMLFEAIFISVFVCSWWKKMKRPADLMNSAARITTASPTTGGVTARMTVETTQTRRTAVSIWLLRFSVSPVCSFICAVEALHNLRWWKNWTPRFPSHCFSTPHFTSSAHQLLYLRTLCNVPPLSSRPGSAPSLKHPLIICAVSLRLPSSWYHLLSVIHWARAPFCLGIHHHFLQENFYLLLKCDR